MKKLIAFDTVGAVLWQRSYKVGVLYTHEMLQDESVEKLTVFRNNRLCDHGYMLDLCPFVWINVDYIDRSGAMLTQMGLVKITW